MAAVIIVKVRRNPVDCAQLSAYTGLPITRWVRFPDGRQEVDVAVDSLTPGKRKALIADLETAETHLVENEPLTPEPAPEVEPIMPLEA